MSDKINVEELNFKLSLLQKQIEKIQDSVDNVLQGISPAQYAVYKGTSGAIQFHLLPACYICKECKEKNAINWQHIKNTDCKNRMELRPGAVLVEITNGVSQHKYDWDNKIKFALSAQDLSAILNAFAQGDRVRRFHDPHKGQPGREGLITRALEFQPGKDGGYIVKAQQISKSLSGEEKTIRHNVGLNADEVRTLRILFGSVLPKLLAWI